MAQTLSLQHGWFDFYNLSSGRKNDNNAGGKVHDNCPSDHFHVHAQLLVSGELPGMPHPTRALHPLVCSDFSLSFYFHQINHY